MFRIWAFSSAGQSHRLITGRSRVQVPEGPPRSFGRSHILYRGIAQLVEQRSPKPRAQGSSPCAPAKKKAKSNFDLDFFICAAGTTSFACNARNIISSKTRTSLPPHAAQMNDVALRANDVLRNDVGLRPMMLRFAQTELDR